METAKKRYEFDGFFAELSAPVEVGRSKGHFWFSSLHPLEGQEVLCEVVRTDDRAQGEWPATLCLSQDGGQTWRRVCDIDCNGPQSLRLGPRRLLLMPYELWPAAPGERRNAVANGTVLSCAEDGAVAAERVPVRFEDFPRDLDDYHEGELSSPWSRGPRVEPRWEAGQASRAPCVWTMAGCCASIASEAACPTARVTAPTRA